VYHPSSIPGFLGEAGRLAELQAYQVLDTPSEPVFDDTVRLAQSLFDVATSTVSLVDTERQWFKARAGLDVSATGRAEAFCAQAITGSDVLTILDAANDERFANNPLVIGAPYIRFYAGAPLVTPTGATIGTLCIFDPVARSSFDESERRHLAMLARIVMDRLEIRRLMIQREERAVSVRGVGSALDEAAQALNRKAHTLADLAYSGICQSEAAVGNVKALVDLGAEMQNGMSTIVSDIGRSTESAKGTCEAVRGLCTHIDGVASVAGMISTIASQSRLLALNASIEAARAGEAGRGFAVVAHEVKQMATRTAEATRHIDSELDSIRQTVTSVISRCGDLVEMMEQMRHNSGAVSDAAERKASVRDKVGSEAETLIEVSRGVGTHAQDVTAASVLLLRQADCLRSQLDKVPPSKEL
jgi:hypothetical protein